ncbi:MAG: DUF5662 family protein [SAR324 cluster bacterium]|nr:DUF5662 family protein [SAR324 cluster bacterium]
MTQPTHAMKDFFLSRTTAHINRVAFNMSVMTGYAGFDLATLEARGKAHDKSKWEGEERRCYTWLTECHRCKTHGLAFEFPAGVEAEVTSAMELHKSLNRHHPEAHSCPDAMENLDIIEMVADWKAMAQEFNEEGGSPRGWVKANISTWDFSPDKKEYIFSTIDHMDQAYLNATNRL